MASNYTSNYGLCQWELEDKVLRSEFNADNAKIDAALSSLRSTASGKVSQSALNSLSQTMAGHTAELAKKGNCQITFLSYIGSGRYGENNVNSLTFPDKPAVVCIAGAEAGWCWSRAPEPAGPADGAWSTFPGAARPSSGTPTAPMRR